MFSRIHFPRLTGLVRSAFDKLVKAGSKVIYDQKTFAQLTQGLADSQTPVEDIAKGMVSVLNMMAHKARGTIPHDALLQAGVALLIVVSMLAVLTAMTGAHAAPSRQPKRCARSRRCGRW